MDIITLIQWSGLELLDKNKNWVYQIKKDFSFVFVNFVFLSEGNISQCILMAH